MKDDQGWFIKSSDEDPAQCSQEILDIDLSVIIKELQELMRNPN